MTLTFLELEQMHIENVFGEIATIAELQDMTYPRLHYNTILNAINTGKLTAKKLNTAGGGDGIWLVHIPSARNIWKARFIAKELN